MAYNNASGLDISLVQEAHDNGIRVIDLCAAGDDIVPADPEPPAGEPEVPVAGEEETPPWEAGPAEDEKPTDPTPPPAEQESPGERVAKATQAGKAAAKRTRAPEPAPEVPASPVAPSGVQFQFTLNVPPEGVEIFARAIVQAMGAQAATVVAAPLATVTELPVGDRGSNKQDVAGQPEGTKPFYYNADEGKYRPARGTKRRGEERVFLTDAEIEEAKSSKMLS
jgi:hypothetical protein